LGSGFKGYKITHVPLLSQSAQNDNIKNKVNLSPAHQIKHQLICPTPIGLRLLKNGGKGGNEMMGFVRTALCIKN
jgi:hypothetical protein